MKTTVKEVHLSVGNRSVIASMNARTMSMASYPKKLQHFDYFWIFQKSVVALHVHLWSNLLSCNREVKAFVHSEWSCCCRKSVFKSFWTFCPLYQLLSLQHWLYICLWGVKWGISQLALKYALMDRALARRKTPCKYPQTYVSYSGFKAWHL